MIRGENSSVLSMVCVTLSLCHSVTLSLTFNVLDQKPHLVVQLINGPSECGGVGGDNAEQQQSCQLCIVSQSVSQCHFN